jgi:hypothetical protein
MLEPNDKYFVQLISRLAQPADLPDAFTASADTDSLRIETLKALRRLPSTDTEKFFAVLDSEAPPHETNTAWHVNPRSPEDPRLKLSFRLSRSLTRDQAVEQAIAYVESKAGPIFKQLTDSELRVCERAAVGNPFQALVLYVANRLPDDLAEQFLQIGASGNDLAIWNFAADKNISEIIQEGIAHVFYWSHVGADEKFFDYVRANDDGRLWTLTLLENLCKRYTVGSSLEKITQAEPQPTPEDFEALSDEEISDLLTQSRRLKNQTR